MVSLCAKHRVFQTVLRGVGDQRFCWGREFFLLYGGNLRWSDFEHLNLFKIKIKIKISMTCVYKDYEIKTKMVQGQ